MTPSENLDGKIALVTGAAGQGIGQATARRLAANGAKVVVTDSHKRRTQEVTRSIAADYPDTVVAGYELDTGNREQIDQVMQSVARDLGPVQILVNNAAVNVTGSIFDYDPDVWDWIVSVNLTGPWYLSRLAMPVMRDAGGGVVINVSSFAPDVGGYGNESPYAVTKGGLNVLTRSLAHEGGPYGIRALTVSLGVIVGTKFVDDRPELLTSTAIRGVLPSLPSATEVADTIAFLASDRAAHITGEIVNIAAGQYMRT